MNISKKYLLLYTSLLIVIITIIHFTTDAQENDNHRLFLFHPITITALQDNEFKDFEILERKIGHSQIVALGEPNHGCGTCFEEKIRLVKFLHEKLGFNVLAFESDFYEANKAWYEMSHSVKVNKPNDCAGVFRIWQQSQEVQPLFEYLKKCTHTTHPLILTGLDIQMPYNDMEKSYLFDIQKNILLNIFHEKDTVGLTAFTSVLAKIIEGRNFSYKPNVVDKEKYISFLKSIINKIELENKNSKDSVSSVWLLTYKNMYAWSNFYFEFSRKKYRDPTFESTRDVKMAENLLYLQKTLFQGKKIIIWGATYHFIKNNNLNKNSFLSMKKTTGSILNNKEKPGNYYVIAFTGVDGTTARPWDKKPDNVPNPAKNSLEAVIEKNHQGSGMVFTDEIDKGWPMQFRAGMLGFEYNKAEWMKMVDCIYYLNEIKRSHAIQK